MASSWIIQPAPNRHARLRLFCFPYAGGGASIFRDWPASLPADSEVCPIQPPGREGRLFETPFVHVDALVAALAPEIRPYLDLPYLLFGHSMGALIAFKLTRLLRAQRIAQPRRLLVSGYRAPHLPDRHPPVYALPDSDLIAHVRNLGGAPPAVLEQAELMALLLPSLRADFQLCDTYTYSPEPPLSIPISAFGGVHDSEVSADEIEGWKEHTTRPCAVRMLPGNHFFLQTSRALLLRAVEEDMTEGAQRS